MAPSRLRDRFKTYAAGYSSDTSIVSQIESAMESLVNNESLEKKIYQAKKEGLISGGSFSDLLEDAIAKGVLTEEEKLILKSMDDLRMNIVNVDDFSEDEIARG
jgi:acyl-CoA dehydrogenase